MNVNSKDNFDSRSLIKIWTSVTPDLCPHITTVLETGFVHSIPNAINSSSERPCVIV